MQTPARTSLQNGTSESSDVFFQDHNLKVFDAQGSILKGIELSIFSYQIHIDEYERCLREVCGTHFQYERRWVSHKGVMTVFISPRDFCLVEGGMMYKSAGSIISDLLNEGFFIQSMNAIVE